MGFKDVATEREYTRAQWQALRADPEKYEEHKRRQRIYVAKRKAAATHEQLEAEAAKRRARYAERMASDPEFREATRQRSKREVAKLLARETPEQTRARYRRDFLKSKYGISSEGYDAMLKAQGGGCAICGRTDSGDKRHKQKILHIDHDHETGAVRGLLCAKCNHGLGKFSDDPLLLAKAIDYLLNAPGE